MKRLSVRKWLTLAFISVGILPLAVFTLAFWSVLRKHLDDDIEQITQTMLRGVSNQTASLIFEEPRRLLPSILMLAGESEETEELQGVVRAFGIPRPEIMRLSLLQGDGRVVAAYPYDANALGSLYPLRSTPSRGRLNVSASFNLAAGTGAALEVSYANETRVAVAVIDLASISSLLVLTAIAPQDKIGVIDGFGRYVLCTDPSRVGLEAPRAESATRRPPLIQEEDGSYYLSMAKIPGTDWQALYLRAKHIADAPMLSYTRIVTALGALGLALSSFFVLISWKTVSAPLNVLISRIELIAAGRYSERVQVAFTPEFNEIANAFNAMADSIERRDRDIQRNEERYRLLFNGNRAPALLIDGADGSVKDANPAAAAFYGYSSGELSVLRIGDLELGMEKTALESMNAAANGETCSVSTRHRLKSGEIRDVELYIGPIEFEDRRYLHAIVFDVTQRRLAEERTETALKEKIQLIQEIYHRVKNNQQLVVSLLRMQTDSVVSAETRRELQNAQERMFAMSLAHDLVYQMENLSVVDAKSFAENLAQYYALSYGAEARPIEVECEELRLELGKAIPFALALNELVASVVRLSSSKASRDPISLRIAARSQLGGLREIQATVTAPGDQGLNGLQEQPTLSVLLVGALAGQLGGEASWFATTADGNRQAELRFPV